MRLNIFQHRLTRFLFFGGTAAAVNMLLIALAVDGLSWNTPVLRNVANVVSVELSLLYSFVVYRLFVWRDILGNARHSAWQQLALYHASAGAATITRWFLIFPVLDRLGVHYALNTLAGIGLSFLINFSLSHRFVFRAAPESEAPTVL